MSNQIIPESNTKISKFKKKKIAKKILSIIFSIIAWLFSIILLFLCVNNIYQKSNKEKYVGFFNIGNAVVESPSMTPTLKVNDLILYKSVDDISTLKENDIIIYTRLNEKTNKTDLIVHRLVSISDGFAITKGDNNAQPDTPFEASNIVGIYFRHFKGVGAIIKFLATPFASIALIVLIIIFIAIRILLYTKKRKKIVKSITDNSESQEAILSFFNI